MNDMSVIYCLDWEGGENIVRGVKISYDIFTPGWEYDGVKILYHTIKVFRPNRCQMNDEKFETIMFIKCNDYSHM